MQQIYFYKLYLFGIKDKEYGYIRLTQEQGQAIIMMLSKQSDRKFILIGGDMVNIAAIERIERCNEKTAVDGKEVDEIRELTAGEKGMQQLFDAFTKSNQKLLTP